MLRDQHYPLAALDLMTVVECTECGLMFTTPVPSQQWQDSFYDPAKNAWWDGETSMEAEWQRLANGPKFRDGLKIIRRLRPSGRLIDVGTGPGLFVRLSLEEGYEATGTEIASEKRVKKAAGHLPILYRAISSLNIENEFDILTLWCVIAHDLDFMTLLRDCRRVLRPGGLLFVETPNMTLWRLLRGFRRTLNGWLLRRPSCEDEVGAYAHINHFTTSTLRRALRQAGFCGTRFHVVKDYGGWPTTEAVKRGIFAASMGRVDVCFPLVATAVKVA